MVLFLESAKSGGTPVDLGGGLGGAAGALGYQIPPLTRLELGRRERALTWNAADSRTTSASDSAAWSGPIPRCMTPRSAAHIRLPPLLVSRIRAHWRHEPRSRPRILQCPSRPG